MSFQMPASLKGLRGFALLVLGVGIVFITAWVNDQQWQLQRAQDPRLPFGFMKMENGSYLIQDFGCNRLYFEGIQEHLVAHPYRLDDQEAIFRHWLPQLGGGMCHAYSPVAFVLAQPLLLVPGQQAYLFYTSVAGIGILLLFRFHLLPRVQCRLQIYALLTSAASICLLTAFEVGQSALITTTLVGFFWLFLQRRGPLRSIGSDLVLAALFWALCLKPSVAYIPLMLLLGAQAWRALALGAALLVATWLALSGYYGGWWSGLMDYLYLLNHYDEAGMTPFMRNVFSRHGDTGLNAYLSTIYPPMSSFFFALSRAIFLGSSLTLLLLRYSRRITLSEQFQGMVWTFLLLCPYLIPAEDWIMCLLVVEGTFFRTKIGIGGCSKLLLFLAIMNLRDGLNFPGQINFPLKCVLLAWIIAEAVIAKRARHPFPPPEEEACPREASSPYPRLGY